MKLRLPLILLLVALFASCDVFVFLEGGSASLASQYVESEAGVGYRYAVSDTRTNPDTIVDAWIVTQDFVEGYAIAEIDFAVTITPATSSSNMVASSLTGVSDFSDGGRSYALFNGGIPVGGPSDIFRIGHVLPANFETGTSYSVNFTSRYGTIDYQLDSASSRTVQGTTYSDVIRIFADVNNAGSSSLNGSGYFYFAEGIGLIEASYSTSGGDTISLQLKEREFYSEKTRVGGSMTSNAKPVAVSVGIGDIGMWDLVAGSDTDYNLSFYGRSIELFYGKDTDSDSILENYTSDELHNLTPGVYHPYPLTYNLP